MKPLIIGTLFIGVPSLADCTSIPLSGYQLQGETIDHCDYADPEFSPHWPKECQFDEFTDYCLGQWERNCCEYNERNQ